jgi:hypothetical protein
LKRAVRGTLRGIDLVRDSRNKTAVLALMADWFKISGDLAQDAYEQMVEAYPASGMVSDEALEKDLDVAKQAGAIKGSIPVSKVVDFQFVKAARKELTAEKR